MTLLPPEPFACYEPAADPASKLLILGEAPGEEEDRAKKPFVGSSGKLLTSLLADAGFDRSAFHITNVFVNRPPNNDLRAWTLTKTELKKLGALNDSRLPPMQGRYLHPDREPELERLRTELDTIRPDFILCLGATALWALLGDSRIMSHRGTFFQYETINCLATFHPAGVLRQWDWRPIVWADLIKVRRFLEGTLPPPITRTIWINPTEEELAYVYSRFERSPTELLGVDIETKPGAGQITSVAFGTAEECIAIPVWNPQSVHQVSGCYGTASEEAVHWRWIERFAQLPNPKVMQNGMYDIQWLLDFGVRVKNVLHDTAILHNAMQPELAKDLGTLGSLYLNTPSWKTMRVRAKDEVKADE